MKKGRGKKGKMVVTDLESFNATEQAVKTSEKDINHKPKEVSKP
jgi:hypothetical protein